MTTPSAPLTCPACRVIDQADGVEDGNLYKVDHYAAKNENRLLEAVMKAQDRVADRITNFAGSLNFVYLHSVWFGIWVLLNVGLLGASVEFDKFPFGLLTMIVSLEAIFLSTFVMIGQNRQAAFAGAKAQHDFVENELELKTNTELTRQIHQLTTELHRRMITPPDGGTSTA
jgi:uncharacterized membrane protein